jgi:CBS domain-containing protein
MSAEIRVADIMETHVTTIDPDKTVKEAATIMADKGFGCLIVVREGKAVGIVTERDIVTKVAAGGVDPTKVLVSDIMSTPLIVVPPSATTDEAARVMTEYNVRRLVVVKDGALSGVVTAGDLAKMLAKEKDYHDASLNAIARLKSNASGGPYQ